MAPAAGACLLTARMTEPEIGVAIAGAGPAGLAVAACLGRRGIPCTVFEQEDRIAPAWWRHYDRLRLHTPKQHSALPFRPYPRDYPTYPSRDEMIEYFVRYAESFDIRPRFSERVQSAVRVDGGFRIETRGGAYRASHLVVATGLNCVPHRPLWPGQERYRGRLLHAAEYRNGEAFRGERVLVVGFGNSAGEIAIDLVEHGARPALAVRSSVHVMPRDVLGVPLVSLTMLLRGMPPALLDRIAAPIARLRWGNLERYGLERRRQGPAARLRADGRIPLIDVGTIRLIRAGRVAVYPGIARFTEDGAVFTDGRRAAFSAVVLSTGYRPDFSFLEDGDRWAARPQALPRGGVPAAPGLFFTGFYVSATGTLREIGIEARAIAGAIGRDAHRSRDAAERPAARARDGR